MINAFRKFGRALLSVLTVLLALVVGSAILFVAVIYIFGSAMVSEVDVATIHSPDDRILAIVEETNGGATTSFGYNVYLRSNSWLGFRKKAASLYGAVRSECAYGVDVVWKSPTEVEIRYLNVRYSPSVLQSLSIAGQVIDVGVVSGVENPSAPCGGMEHRTGEADRA